MGKNHSLWARMARNWDKMVFSQRMSTCQTQDFTQRGEKSHFKWHIYSPRPEIFQRHRGVVSGLKKPQRNKRKKEEKKKNKASQSTNNLVCWALARDADGSDLRPSEQRNALQHSQWGPSHKPVLGVPLSPSGWEKKKKILVLSCCRKSPSFETSGRAVGWERSRSLPSLILITAYYHHCLV